MRRNFIDTDPLNTAIADELANLVPLLTPYRQPFENVLRRNLPEMRLGTRTLPRVGDPRWAHDRRAAGEPLFRLGQSGLLEARRIAGDEDLSALLIGGVRQQWRNDIRDRFAGVVEHAQDRWRRAGDIV